jgi:hemolysin III
LVSRFSPLIILDNILDASSCHPIMINIITPSINQSRINIESFLFTIDKRDPKAYQCHGIEEAKFMSESQTIEQYSFLEEIFNSVTHGIGVLISITGLVLLIVFSRIHGDLSLVISCTVFGIALVLLYTASTLYHSSQKSNVKHVFKILDHSCIYILIAGTYTPFLLVTLRGVIGWSMFALIWSLAVTGVLFKVFFIHRFKIISTIAYILMGWIIILAIKPLFQALPDGGLAWLICGGLAYTLGTIFFAWEKLPFNHTIWHLFVLTGSVCHFFAVMFYVIPQKI